MAAKRPDLTAQLRQAMTASDLSMYALAKRAGVSVSMVQQFMAGRDIRLATAAKLAALLDLELRRIDHPAQGNKRKGR